MDAGLVTQADIARRMNELNPMLQAPNWSHPRLAYAPAYWFWRDFKSPTDRVIERARVLWRFDRVRYSGLPLPDGSPCRSLGHWNRVDQLEYFAVVEGEITMEITDPGGTSQRFELDTYRPVLSIPPGSWHLTYASGPALVDNIYCFVSGNGSPDSKEKYGRGRLDSPRTSDESTPRADKFHSAMSGASLVQLFEKPTDPAWDRLDRCVRLLIRDL